MAEKSEYDFDDLLEDDESRELEDMFNILDTQKQKKLKPNKLEKALHTKRPFKFIDESIEDWTESYSDDSEESGAEDLFEEVLEIDEEPDFKVTFYSLVTIENIDYLSLPKTVSSHPKNAEIVQ
ncbi:uncharacterized protein NPIL_590681 [Nephila pilipes]|uniref:Uncharacterized protein n=1 Tax=Nephila pilipes TaxID=299642 RepID=A0A8X6IVU9_NEPPI|nr:uncharacterized protein NPIL_73771 [Nephila pilipes]GFS64303.1 uncharacterized protein NPIL_100261 [Nephila pilipes]GFU09596.1 uncharacterized protein NPIL_590681 [Nephila pilipes]